jgi:hypothetical protein
MIFKDNRQSRGFFKAKKNGFEYVISATDNKFYVVASSLKKDIRFNSLWSNLRFNNFEDAVSFCKNFNYKSYRCLGSDV